MKLAAIYNVWDGVELLRGSMECLKSEVDLFIIICQDTSNFGEKYDPCTEIDLTGINHLIYFYDPDLSIGASANEKKKRNLGILHAIRNGCTHFLHMDCDEYYWNFPLAKKQYIESKASGSVCKIYPYFKKPTFRFENADNYYVPFIHELKADTMAGYGDYPFYVDPTRKINESNVVEIQTTMHHFTWVRRDIERKVRNSSARANIEKSQLLKDYYDPEIKPGSYVKDFRQTLIEVENIFNIQI